MPPWAENKDGSTWTNGWDMLGQPSRGVILGRHLRLVGPA